ncbi:MAG TPA: hypothetical protein VGU25_10175 [Acidobacteriaceae bacterium]|nr:hypothetical protein [Acidobacteriaceae bacterium]
MTRGSQSRTSPPKLFSAAGFFCVLLLAVCIIITWPFAQIGINDDWVYSLIAFDFARTGHFLYHGWASPILGWQAMWGALFVRLFGASFNVIRLSSIPIALATVLLYHGVLRRFGLNPAHAVFGTLTFALSPLFLPLTATFMTDVSSLFAILVCVYLCQRAIAAHTNLSAISWLAAAALTNIALGTVRQIAWLGLLVIVPSCGWLLRRRRFALPATAVLWLIGAICIRSVLHWFARQPYSAPLSLLPPRQAHNMVYVHLANSIWRTLLATLLYVLPVLAMGVAALRQMRSRSFVAPATAAAIVIVLWLAIPAQIIDPLLPPWLGNVVTANGIMQSGGLFGSTRSVPPWILACVAALVAFCAVACVQTFLKFRASSHPQAEMSWRTLSILLLPFTAVYCCLLVPLASSLGMIDRYLLEILAVLLVFLLRLHQERISPRIPAISVAILAIGAVIAIAGTHDLFAMDRARVRLLDEVQRSGVPRTAVSGGFEFDAVTQVQAWGYFNDPRIKNPPDAFKPQPDAYVDTDPCRNPLQVYAPAVHAIYVLEADPIACLHPSQFPPATYQTWLPPAKRQLFIGIRNPTPASWGQPSH